MDVHSVPLPDVAPDSGAGRTLVAGIGNIFLGDDGFGVETVGRLTGRPLPSGVDLMDAGIRGVHLAYRLLDGYRRLVLVDAVDRGVPPGTVQVIDVDPADVTPAGTEEPGPAQLDGHSMDPVAVLRLMGELHIRAGGTLPEEVVVVGCQPLTLAEGIGLSDPVAAAVEGAVELVLDLVRQDDLVQQDDLVRQDEGDDPDDGEHDLAVGVRGSGGGGSGVRDGEIRPGRAPLSADAADVRRADR